MSIWAGDDVVLVAAARSWTVTLYEASAEGGFWLLTAPEQDAVRRVVAAVVHRDAAVVATLMAADHWGDTPIEDWDGDVRRDDEPTSGSASVVVDLLDADHPEERTDLSLELDLSYDAAGELRVRAATAPHVM